MEKYLVEVNGKKIQVADTGEGVKGTIVGIHGLTGNHMQLSYYVDRFGEDYRFITMDLMGRANSKATGNDSGIFQHADDVSAIIDDLELKDVILMGYSMGAFIASVIASKSSNVKAVVLLDGAATMSEHQRPIVEPSLGRLSKHFDSSEQYISQVADGYETFGIAKSDRLNEILAYEIEEKDGYWENKGSEIVVRNDWETFWDYDVKRGGPSIKQPVLLIQASEAIGSNPPLFLPEHYEDTIEYIENIEVVVSDSNHYTMVFNNREDINTYISDFLSKL